MVLIILYNADVGAIVLGVSVDPLEYMLWLVYGMREGRGVEVEGARPSPPPIRRGGQANL